MPKCNSAHLGAAHRAEWPCKMSPLRLFHDFEEIERDSERLEAPDRSTLAAWPPANTAVGDTPPPGRLAAQSLILPAGNPHRPPPRSPRRPSASSAQNPSRRPTPSSATTTINPPLPTSHARRPLLPTLRAKLQPPPLSHPCLRCSRRPSRHVGLAAGGGDRLR